MGSVIVAVWNCGVVYLVVVRKIPFSGSGYKSEGVTATEILEPFIVAQQIIERHPIRLLTGERLLDPLALGHGYRHQSSSLPSLVYDMDCQEEEENANLTTHMQTIKIKLSS